jgi:predicted metal-dependent phosphotriesterase family hydrolase
VNVLLRNTVQTHHGYKVAEGVIVAGAAVAVQARLQTKIVRKKDPVTVALGDQLLLANDLCLKGSLHRYGGVGYDHAFRNFIPMMRMYGISEADIRKIVYDNPKRFLFQV